MITTFQKKLFLSLLINFLILVTNAYCFQNDLIDKGQELFYQQKYEEAKKVFEQVSRENPSSQEALYWLGYTHDRIHFGEGTGLDVIDWDQTVINSEFFEHVISIDSAYSGDLYILGPYAKITSLWGALSLYYEINNDSDLSKKAFMEGKKRGGFYPALLEFSENLLSSCEPNSILFVNGDMDTYPLFYLQQMEGVRKDVTVINLSLLNTPWYREAIIDNTVYSQNNMSYLRNNSKAIFPNKENPESIVDTLINNQEPKRFEGAQIKIPVNNHNFKTDTLKWFMKAPNEYQGIKYTNPANRALIMALILNKFDRPVYFSTTVSQKLFLGLDQFFLPTGLAYKLHPDHRSTKSIPTEVLSYHENLLLNEFSYEKLNTGKVARHLDDISIGMYRNYRFLIYSLAQNYTSRANYEKSIELLENIDNIISSEIIPYTQDESNYKSQILEYAEKTINDY